MRRLAVLPPSPRFPPSACLALPRHLHSAALRRLIDDSPFLLRPTTHAYCLRLAASLDASPGPSARTGNKDTTQYGTRGVARSASVQLMRVADMLV